MTLFAKATVKQTTQVSAIIRKTPTASPPPCIFLVTDARSSQSEPYLEIGTWGAVSASQVRGFADPVQVTYDTVDVKAQGSDTFVDSGVLVTETKRTAYPKNGSTGTFVDASAQKFVVKVVDIDKNVMSRDYVIGSVATTTAAPGSTYLDQPTKLLLHRDAEGVFVSQSQLLTLENFGGEQVLSSRPAVTAPAGPELSAEQCVHTPSSQAFVSDNSDDYLPVYNGRNDTRPLADLSLGADVKNDIVAFSTVTSESVLHGASICDEGLDDRTHAASINSWVVATYPAVGANTATAQAPVCDRSKPIPEVRLTPIVFLEPFREPSASANSRFDQATDEYWDVSHDAALLWSNPSRAYVHFKGVTDVMVGSSPMPVRFGSVPQLVHRFIPLAANSTTNPPASAANRYSPRKVYDSTAGYGGVAPKDWVKDAVEDARILWSQACIRVQSDEPIFVPAIWDENYVNAIRNFVWGDLVPVDGRLHNAADLQSETMAASYAVDCTAGKKCYRSFDRLGYFYGADLPPNFHPAAVRVLTVDTPFGAG